MSTAEAKVGNIAETLQTYSGSSTPLSDLEETVRTIENTQTVMFAFHAWLPFNNIGPEGFKFNIQHPVLERLKPIHLPVYPVPIVVPRFSGQIFAVGGVMPGTVSADGMVTGGAVPARGSAPNVVQGTQLPSQSMRELQTAYGRYGMVALSSMTAQTPAEARIAYALFEAVMGVAESEEEMELGRRPEGLLLEDFPHWLEGSGEWKGGGAERALRHALKQGVTLKTPVFEREGPAPGISPRILDYRREQVKLAGNLEGRGLQLIGEVYQSVQMAHRAALDPSDGVLPRTKELLNITANKGQGGKTHADPLDEWLLEQFPSFDMDTDVARAQRALQGALAEGGSSETSSAILAMVEEMKEQRKQTDKVLEMALKKGEK